MNTQYGLVNNSLASPLPAMLDCLAVSPAAMRRIIIDQSHRAGVGHIGSALSVVELVACLYGGAMRIENPEDKDRDRFYSLQGPCCSGSLCRSQPAGMDRSKAIGQLLRQ